MSDTTPDAGTATLDAGETQTDAAAPAAAPSDTTAAPAEVEYKFETPEGVSLDESDLTEFKTIAKELALKNDDAKRFVDLAVKREVARAEAFAKQVSDWGDAVKADKELGTPENLAIATSAIETFGTPELRDLLNSSGLGNHPEVIRIALKFGKAISEDKVIASKTAGGTPAFKDHASILYGNPQ